MNHLSYIISIKHIYYQMVVRFDRKPYKLEVFPDLPDTKWFI
jgi:hypothetical protein